MQVLIHDLILFILILPSFAQPQKDERKMVDNGKTTILPVTDEHAMTMYQKWADSALSSFFSAFAHKRLKKKRRSTLERFAECNSRAKDVIFQAKCVTRLLRNGFDKKKYIFDHLSRYRYKTEKRPELRSKRSIRARKAEGYRIKDAKERITPLGSVAKMLMDTVLRSKNKTEGESWQLTVSRLKKVAKERDQRKAKKELETDSEEKLNQMSSYAFQRNIQKENDKTELDNAFKDPSKMEKFIEKKLKNGKMKPEGRVMQFVKDAVKLAYSLAGSNTTNFDKKDMKFVSPRFFGVVKEKKKKDEIDLLSPSLFSLHDEGEGIENLTSIPQLLKGFDLKDQQVWLDFILEAAGVTDQTKNLEENIDDNDKLILGNFANETDPSKFRRADGHPLYFTKDNITEVGGTEAEKAKVEYYQEFLKTMSKKQIAEMNSTGYSILRKDQIDIIYGQNSPYNNSNTHKLLSSLSTTEIHQRIPQDIALISEMENFKLRQKDIVLSPVVLTPLVLLPDVASQPIVLSPLLFTPVILSPALMGPVILSPWMFVPVIISPRVLSPLIVSPFVLSPVVLSPLVLHPVILSPGVLDPVVLTPFVLSPVILSPLVFVPIILSPLVLSPLILSPAAGSPLILSPFVLSPIILSPQAVSALFLSPYALSPVIGSELIIFAAILSPSWLS